MHTHKHYIQYSTRCLFMRLASTLVAILVMALISETVLAANDSMRCGTRLVHKGDLAIQVREKCGKPTSTDIIGYTLRRDHHHSTQYPTNRRHEYKIEQWIYGPERGFYQEIIFEAGRVKRINNIKK